METIDIEKIMDEIRAEIKAKGYTNDLLSFDDFIAANIKPKTIEECYETLNNSWNIPAYRILHAKNGILGKLKLLFQKTLRKSIKFYIEPIVSDQDAFNANVVQLLNMMKNYMDLNDQKIELLQHEIEQLKKLQKK